LEPFINDDEYFSDKDNLIHWIEIKNDFDLDLWTTFNVVQENLMRGGIVSFKLNDLGYPIARQSTRAVNSISKNLDLNKNLWTLANKFLISTS
jgi:hypothetical protein